MADRATLAKARRELEELYLGIPDDSVNLTFGDLADVKQHAAPSEKRKSGPLEPISEVNPKREEVSRLTKLPSLDFNRGFQGASQHHAGTAEDFRNHRRGENHHHHHHVDRGSSGYNSPRRDVGFRHAVDSSMAYDDMSGFSVASTSPYQQGGGGGGGRRRPGIPHSNICTVCSNYIYIFRHRCLVCGRAYCRQCVSVGMGEMTEGRKCIECLGRRFSERYIQRAGQVGCCMKFKYSTMVMQQELKWAEKGPRRTGERRYGSTMMSRSRSPITPRTPARAHAHAGPVETPSFVMSSPYSAYSPTNHPIPF